MRVLLRTFAVISLCLALASPAGAAKRGDGSERSRLQRRADAAAARFDRAEVALERLSDDIARLERKISDGEAKMAPLRANVTRRAVALYTADRGFDALSGLTNGGDLVESARGAKLASGASARDYAAMKSLAAATGELTRRRDELAAKQAAQQRVADTLAGEQKTIQLALADIAKRERALQARLIPRASRGERAPLPAAGSGSPIPVATNFICPVRGPMTFTDSWGAPRSGGRRHAGTDIMNPHGTPNVAVVSGSFETNHSGAGGLTIYLHGDDGHTYYYAHLSKVVGPDRRVAQGEVVALTGATGNARAPHTHFEFHPNGGAAVNPYPIVRSAC